jgi:Calpain family cysteine protease
MALTNRGRTPGPAGTFRDLEEDLAFSYPEARPRFPGPSGIVPRGILFYGPFADSGGGSGSAQRSLPPVKLEEPEATFAYPAYDLLPEAAPLFKKKPKPDDVVQGRLGNCPLHAILVAMAHAKPKELSQMINPTSVTVISTLADDKKFRKQTDVLMTVQFRDAKPIEISTLLYRNPVDAEGDGGDLPYAHSDNGVSWVSFFEKAYVKLRAKNSYVILDKNGGNVRQIMTDVAGPFLHVDLLRGSVFTPEDGSVKEKDLSDKLLGNILKAAKQHPTIAASLDEAPGDKIVSDHGYGVLGFDGKRVHLRNPWGPNQPNPEVFLSLADFKKNFEAVIQATS